MTRQELFNIKFPPSYSKAAYEIWFSVVIDNVNQKAFWIRHSTLFSNNTPIAVVWASFFDLQNINSHCYAANVFPINAISMSNNTYLFPNASLNLDRLSGSLKTSKGLLTWDLNYQHQFEAFDYTPKLIKNSPLKSLVKTHSASCSPFAKVNGALSFNEKTYSVRDASGVLTHIWGTNRVEKLFWIFAPFFDNDTEGWALEIASIRLKPFLPAITVVKLLHKGILHYESSLISLLSPKVKVAYPSLEIEAVCKEFKLLIKAQLNLEQTTPYIYRNPDGKARYIEQSDVSTISCVIKKGNKKQELLTKIGAVEFHGLTAWSQQTYLDPYNQKQ